MRLIRLLLWCAIIAAGCSPQEEALKAPHQTQDMRPESSFIGTWTLVEWTRESDDEDVVYPYGEDAFGRIIYTEDGHMAAILMRRDRATIGNERVGELSAEDRAILGDGFFAYSGTFEVDPADKKVIHHVDSCTNPNWVGQDRTRTFEMVGNDRIVLRTTEVAPFSVLTWERER